MTIATIESRILHDTPTVRAFIFDEARRVLLIKRGPGFEEGKWGVPGGKLNNFLEDKYEAVRREVMEEVGLTYNPRVIGVGYEEDGKGLAYPTLYFCGWLEGVPHVDGVEAVAFSWSTLEGILHRRNLAFNGGKSLKGVVQSMLTLGLEKIMSPIYQLQP